MNNDSFKEYARIKKMIAELEIEADGLKPAILDELRLRTKDMEEKNLKFDFGTFSVTSRKTWVYGEKVKQAEDVLKAVKALEEADGTAKATTTESLRYTP